VCVEREGVCVCVCVCRVCVCVCMYVFEWLCGCLYYMIMCKQKNISEYTLSSRTDATNRTRIEYNSIAPSLTLRDGG
jgi:hypothetical protein